MDNEKCSNITHIVIDVDGTLTDGGIYYDNNGNELKKFNTRDAAGFFAAKVIGIKTIIFTGRECAATMRRMEDLKADIVQQGIANKSEWLKTFMREQNLSKDNFAYIGDDLNDLPPMQLCGFVACPADACSEVKEISDYISDKNGGYGAARDCIEYVLKKCNQWKNAITEAYQLSGI
jgi:3-deoxy-D-manno-octulosonate 8-phosphate phosphatase (KDO 8-P phosphatase)